MSQTQAAGTGIASRDAAQAGTARPDWTLRLFDAVPLPPFATGALLVAIFAAIGALFRATAPLFSANLTPLPTQVWDLVNGLVFAVPLTLNAYAWRGALRDAAALAPHLEPAPGAAGVPWRPVDQVPRGWVALVRAVALATMLGVVLFDPTIWRDRMRPGVTDPALWWALFHNCAGAYAFGGLFATEVWQSLAFRDLGARIRIQLLDPTPLAMLARRGQRTAVLWVVFSSALSLFWLGGEASLVNGFVLALALAVIAFSFAAPLTRVHERIVAAKQAELARVNARLEALREPLLAGPAGDPALRDGRVADLVAWRSLVHSVGEWPLNLPALLRSLAVVLLGIGSWLGGAVVDRLLDAVLPR